MNKKNITLADYSKIVGSQVLDELAGLARPLNGITVKMVNSTAVGGGVAEILVRLVPLLNELGINTKWEVIKGEQEFFEVTKTFHNALHGDPVQITEAMFDVFNKYNDINAAEMNFDEDVVVIHDPQPCGLIQKKPTSKAKWIWRCHIDLSHPNNMLWDFLKAQVNKYDASIFSAPQFSKELDIPQFMITPSIDPLADKNRFLTEAEVNKTIEKFNLSPGKPLITQISRFDRLKDPVGVIEAYKIVKKRIDCQLVLAGGGATDDPEAVEVLKEVQEKADNDPDVHILELPPFSDIEINALQRASDVILQKSLKEGFGLTVTEGLWKGRPVIAGSVGGIPLQIRHQITGILVHSVEGAAYHIKNVLNNPEMAKKLAQNGKEQVRDKFLLTRNLRNYLLLLNIILKGENKRIVHL